MRWSSPGEAPGAVNRDWLAFMRAADGLDPTLKNEAFRDKLRLRTLHQLVGIALADPEVVRALVKAGADIQFVGELRHSLEDVYLQLVKAV